MSLIDISTNSPHYFYWKCIGTVNENLSGVKGLSHTLVVCLGYIRNSQSLWLTFTQLQLIGWLTDWLVADLLTDLLTTLLTNLLTNWLAYCFNYWLADWLTDCVADRLVDLLATILVTNHWNKTHFSWIFGKFCTFTLHTFVLTLMCPSPSPVLSHAYFGALRRL